MAMFNGVLAREKGVSEYQGRQKEFPSTREETRSF
jgi:hypothetical protein